MNFLKEKIVRRKNFQKFKKQKPSFFSLLIKKLIVNLSKYKKHNCFVFYLVSYKKYGVYSNIHYLETPLIEIFQMEDTFVSRLMDVITSLSYSYSRRFLVKFLTNVAQ